MRQDKITLIGMVLVLAGLFACGSDDEGQKVTEFVAHASDFECLLQWEKVRKFRMTNKAGKLDQALAVARGEAPLPFPIGTIIQLVPNEAMVKRGGGFNPEGNDWEFFFLDTSSGETKIVTRGANEVNNVFGGNCFTCHSAARNNDFICETGHGCVLIPLTDELINTLQATDPRCQ